MTVDLAAARQEAETLTLTAVALNSHAVAHAAVTMFGLCDLVEELTKERDWVRKKLGVPLEGGMASGNPSVCGTLHVWEFRQSQHRELVVAMAKACSERDELRERVKFLELQRDAERLDLCEANQRAETAEMELGRVKRGIERLGEMNFIVSATEETKVPISLLDTLARRPANWADLINKLGEAKNGVQKWCPECGCEKYSRGIWEEGNMERICAECDQSWFHDVDYPASVTPNPLVAERDRLKQRVAELTEFRNQLVEAIGHCGGRCSKQIVGTRVATRIAANPEVLDNIRDRIENDEVVD